MRLRESHWYTTTFPDSTRLCVTAKMMMMLMRRMRRKWLLFWPQCSLAEVHYQVIFCNHDHTLTFITRSRDHDHTRLWSHASDTTRWHPEQKSDVYYELKILSVYLLMQTTASALHWPVTFHHLCYLTCYLRT